MLKFGINNSIGDITHVFVVARERFAVSTTSSQVNVGCRQLLMLLMDDERRVEHRDESNADVWTFTVDGYVGQEHGQHHQPATTSHTYASDNGVKSKGSGGLITKQLTIMLGYDNNLVFIGLRAVDPHKLINMPKHLLWCYFETKMRCKSFF